MEGSTAKTHSMNGIVIVLACLMASCGGSPSSSETTPHASPTYLGQQPPGETPEPFAPGIVNTDAIELNGVVSPDGREFFFTRVIDDVFVMHRCLLGEDGSWSAPEPVYTYPDRAPGLAVDMAYSPDGSRLYFLGRYSEDLGADETNADVTVPRNAVRAHLATDSALRGDLRGVRARARAAVQRRATAAARLIECHLHPEGLGTHLDAAALQGDEQTVAEVLRLLGVCLERRRWTDPRATVVARIRSALTRARPDQVELPATPTALSARVSRRGLDLDEPPAAGSPGRRVLAGVCRLPVYL